MLRMAPEKRETMEFIAPKLSELNDKCRVESYCTKRQNEPVIRRQTNLSEIEGVIFGRPAAISDQLRRRSRDIESVYQGGFDSPDPNQLPGKPDAMPALPESDSSMSRTHDNLPGQDRNNSGSTSTDDKDAVIASLREKLAQLETSRATADQGQHLEPSVDEPSSNDSRERLRQPSRADLSRISERVGANGGIPTKTTSHLRVPEKPLLETSSGASTDGAETVPSHGQGRKFSSKSSRFFRKLFCWGF